MEKHIQQILEDIYQYDSSLKDRESELISIIQEILMLKPDTKFDDVFREQLRARLMNKIKFTEPKKIFMRKLNYTFGLVAVMAILVISTLYVNDQNGNKLSFLTPGVKITKAGERAFGELVNVTAVNGGQGGGGNAAMGATAAPTTDSVKSSEALLAAPDAKIAMPIYEATNYKYVYNGEPLNLTEPKMDVLKKQKSESIDLSSWVGSLNLGLINLGSFGNAKLQYATFMQDGQDGYSISVDAINGSVSLYGSWPVMAVDASVCPVPMKESNTDAFRSPCYPQPVKIEEIPADEELISVASQFIADHNISLSAYGEPEVVSDFRVQYENAVDKSQVYLPEVVSVVYPLVIEGQTVFDESGNKSGLMIGVHIRNKKVVSVWDLSLQNYQSSTYDTETDASRIMKLVEQGGLYGYVDPSAQRTVEIQLGDPQIELVRMWNYNNNISEELMVPSLVFPVLKQPVGEQYFYRKAVVIPLIKEILDRNGGGYPTPLMEKAQQ